MRKKIHFFVSYARANKDLGGRFLEKFQEQLAPSKKYNYILWRDNRILVGEQWHDEIQNALDRCDMGLLLVSPAFLGSRYISEHELPRFVGEQAKPVIPVMLQPVDFELHDLKGLEKAQIFRLDKPRFRSPKAYGECNSRQRDEFTMDLFRHVEWRLGKLFLNS
jgi:hypothetical protein